MRAHDEMEQLSALIDGELSADERTRVEAHVAGCAECRRVLEALRSTATDLALLGVAEPSPQDSWALRAAIRRTRGPSRWRRANLAMGTAAASLVAVLAIVLTRGGGTPAPELALTQDAAREAGPSLVYDAASVRARAGQLAASFATPPGAAGAGAAAPAQAANAPLPPDVRRCLAQIKGADALELLDVEMAQFEQRAALLYEFRAPDRVEIWVFEPAACELLFFTQARIR